MRTKVGVWDWEEHVYIFTAVTAPNLSSTVSLAELHSALASVSPVLLVEEWQHRLELTFTTMDKAYDALQGEFQMPMDLNKFVVMAGEKWNMTSNEAKRFFRLCDFDAKEKMTRSKFLSVMEVVKPSLRLEHVRWARGGARAQRISAFVDDNSKNWSGFNFAKREQAALPL
ncbi:unnamed protein product [Effrenium voratum]|uniref:EF-hand domain-containing protein n=1 Tax=Effrenium voratum TaxID=2562239 RepID=A0AA36NJV3_9DINO|nr:unnamed protein product [Effrenium voratum]